ncbi:MAG: N-acetylmuramoyl-L-alanine amidase [Defluviitaleaceae bacterium]|nr:N-acetylmuramoyl-L-alanine amidase [Defluviitaleaceae bacterium]
MRIAISSGHGLHVRGASGFIDEVDEARRVADRVAEILDAAGMVVDVFHENEARTQQDNVSAIVRYHNRQMRDLDVSVHFNAVAGIRGEGIGTEVCYKAGDSKTKAIASRTAKAISDASGLILRRGDGTWARTDLGFLNSTTASAILLEICFVNSRTDTDLYQQHFDAICYSIAMAVTRRDIRIQSIALEPSLSAFPISETNLQTMYNLGVMNSLSYWREITNVQWLDELLTNAAYPGMLDNRVSNGITDTAVAIDVLTDAGIITTPDYWKALLQAEDLTPYLGQLLINIANRSRIILEKIIHAEAQGEDLKGQVLVGNVIMNRHNNSSFPGGIHNVVFQSGINSQDIMTYQFSPIGNGSYANAIPSASVRQAVDQVLNDVDHSRGALFFRSIRGAEGGWHELNLEKLFDHGGHRFYR